MLKTLDQAAYDDFFQTLEDLGEGAVYPFSPPEEAGYPFLRMGMIQVVPVPTKTAGLANLFFNFDIYGQIEDRGRVSMIAAKAMQALSAITTLGNGAFRIRYKERSSPIQINPEATGTEELWRAQCSLEFFVY